MVAMEYIKMIICEKCGISLTRENYDKHNLTGHKVYEAIEDDEYHNKKWIRVREKWKESQTKSKKQNNKGDYYKKKKPLKHRRGG